MKKPNITEELANEGTCAVYSDDNRVTDVVVSEMIDALIDSYNYFEQSYHDFELTEFQKDLMEKQKDALKKAGCYE